MWTNGTILHTDSIKILINYLLSPSLSASVRSNNPSSSTARTSRTFSACVRSVAV